MKLTKKIEQEVLKVYNTGWEAYMRGDLKTHASCLSSKFKIIGTTEAEHFTSKKAWLAFCKKTIHQVVGVAQMRNRKIKLEAVGDGVMVVENSAIYVLIDGTWQFYSKLRITALMRKEKSGWKYVHQHGSLPDTRASENETIATEKIKKENQQLRNAVKRRTMELEKKNRELEIEAAVERVRAKALAMNKSEDVLSVVIALKNEITDLKLEAAVTATTIFLKQDDGGIRMWDLTSLSELNLSYHKNFDIIINPKEVDPRLYFIRLWRATGNYTVVEQNLADFKIMLKWLRGIDENASNEIGAIIKKYNITHGYHPAVRLSHGWLCLDLNTPPPDELKFILTKMGAAFDLAYQRFLDLQKAEAQAREAQIQLSLERVRARTMAMQQADELSEVLSILFKQYDILGISPVYTFLSLIDLERNSVTYRQTGKGGSKVLAELKFTLDQVENWGQEEAVKEIRKGNFEVVHCHHAPPEALPSIWEVFGPIYDTLPQGSKVYPEDFPDGIYSVQAFCQFGYIGYDHNRPWTEEEKTIAQRFAVEFGRLYQRFLDLQKAEAQAREAQIEASLERIRAQAMALRNSGEWKNIIRLVFQEWKKLGVSPYECSINVIDRVTREFTNWATGSNNESDALTCYKVQPWHHSYLNDFYRDFFAGVKYRTDFLKGKRWTSFLDGLFTHSDFKDAPQAYKDQLYAVKAIHVSHANNYHTSLDLFDFEPLPEDKAKVMMRIAAVVEMAYTRYLDIKTAEAQAREAQIEVAVERVRAKALAMHKSEEIMSVIKSLRQELDGLKIPGVVGTTIYLKQDDGRIRFWDITTLEENEDGAHFTMDKYLRLEECPDFLWFQRLFRHEEKYLIVGQHEEELKRSMEWIRQSINEEVALSMIAFFEETRSWHLWHPRVLLEHGVMNIDLIQPPPAEAEPILIKMGAAFDLAYKRFLDLQKAEAQAREAQIEAGLERVRSRSLAMHKTAELQSVIHTVHQELLNLNISISGGSFIVINSELDTELHCWGSGGTADTSDEVRIPYFNKPFYTNIVEGLKKGPGFFTEAYTQQEKKEFFTFLFKHEPWSKLGAKEKWDTLAAPGGYTRSCSVSQHTSIFIINHFGEKFSDADNEILKRFGRVFEQAYTRFLDLQKAEAQARESQIEVAVERVRAQSMAMHHPDDLDNVNKELLNQLHQLQIPGLTGVTFYLTNENGWVNAWDFSSPGNIGAPNRYTLQFDFTKYEMMGEPFRALLQSNLDYYVADYTLEKLEKAVSELEEINPVTAIVFREALANGKLTHQWSACAKISNGILGVDMVNPPSEDAKTIVLKMAGAFNQAHTRFLDLQKAEAQAREAQIEASLERVRAKAMGMHHSDELSDVLVVLFQQFDILNIHPTFTVINLFDVVNNKFTHITTGKGGMRVISQQTIALDALETWQEMVEDWGKYNKTQMVKTVHYPVEVIPKVFEIFHEIRLAIPEEGRAQIEDFPNGMFHTLSYCQFGNIGFVHVRAATDEEKNILSRFAREFDRLYQRFLDLQKAEAQAREAQIEAALEKVRSRAMAMQKSDELLQVIKTLSEQLRHLGLHAEAVSFLTDGDERGYNMWLSSPGEDFLSKIFVPRIQDRTTLLFQQAKETGKRYYSYVLSKEEKDIYFQNFFDNTVLRDYPDNGKEQVYAAPGMTTTNVLLDSIILSVSNFDTVPFSDQENEIINRIAFVFQQTYTRFLDLQKAEAQAKEAVKQSSLDRIRGEIASMRTTNDLERITPLIWKELTILNIPFIRCGVFIMDDQLQQIHTFLSTPDGKAIAAFHLPYDAQARTREILHNWIHKQAYIEHWDEFAFSELGDLLVQQGALASKDVYLKTIPPGGLYLHCLPFMQGMLYVGNTVKLNEDEIQLIQSVADAFATAYARYEDFNKLEAAKQQVDKALVELKQTQQQLIQSEKMASLGELTAGIAHEIQNPLNFVNNFSEVSNELLDEMNEELSKGDIEEAKLIANDVKQNLEKILHHGKRADGIVKGMLQHSRSSSGTKEPTDINALADEYLRLAYHGLRAKDKSFNAKFETHFDESIGKVEMVPQDVGRVILNLITNAFYVVAEKKKQNPESYEPTVMVSSKKVDGKVELSVKDNGLGIPNHIKEKIFQPFFTTKPTGQGTGLGLSLSYDIVKAHGGELSVETKEGEGSVFIISLPIKNAI